MNAMRQSLFAFLLLACASGGESQKVEESPRADSSPRTFGTGGTPLHYLILGDSTAVAVGGSYENGLAIRSARHLAATHAVELINVAVSGARIHDVLVEQLPRADVRRADLILLDVGANDVIQLTRFRDFDRDYGRVIQTIKMQNPGAKIVVTGSADMGSPPRVPRILRPLANYRTRKLNEIVARYVERERLCFAPIARETGPEFRRDRTLFSDDRFHPNDRGYAVWTRVINAAIDRCVVLDRPQPK